MKRRELLKVSLYVLAAAPLTAAIAACSKDQKPFTCTDTTGLTPDELAARKALEYVDTAPDPNKDCSKCQQYVAAAEAGKCGTCKVMKGPVHPRGYCKAFAAKTT
jgi:hypothetical protein